MPAVYDRRRSPRAMGNSVEFEGRLRRVNSRQNARVKELRRGFRRGGAQRSRAKLRLKACTWWRRRSAADCGSRRSSSASRRASARTNCCRNCRRTPKLCCCRMTFLPAPCPAKLRRELRPWCGRNRSRLDDVFVPPPALLVVTAGLQDPGNLGTIARSAEAFGVTGMLLGERTVSPWNWKAVRASAGSLFRLPIAEGGTGESAGGERSRGRAGAGDVVAQGNADCGCRLARAGGVSGWQRRSGAPEGRAGAGG